ncbi:MAG: hypothetical protein JRN19_05455 [Nitrososphaerota archaeon]|nr:hypothetical protein [Nitrososphaerota archaeon]MDG7048926.1 hypothetical protein [Nitrososphaerota archaeon]MDG7051880.1 hypothetical protein [Nitrososphaerota archaeon]
MCGNCGFNTQRKSEYNDHMEQAHGIAVRRTSVAEPTQMDKVLGAFSRLCGHENKEVTKKEILEEMAKAGIGQDEGLRCIQSLQRNGQIYEKKPGRFLLTFPGMEGTLKTGLLWVAKRAAAVPGLSTRKGKGLLRSTRCSPAMGTS